MVFALCFNNCKEFITVKRTQEKKEMLPNKYFKLDFL